MVKRSSLILISILCFVYLTPVKGNDQATETFKKAYAADQSAAHLFLMILALDKVERFCNTPTNNDLLTHLSTIDTRFRLQEQDPALKTKIAQFVSEAPASLAGIADLRTKINQEFLSKSSEARTLYLLSQTQQEKGSLTYEIGQFAESATNLISEDGGFTTYFTDQDKNPEFLFPAAYCDLATQTLNPIVDCNHALALLWYFRGSAAGSRTASVHVALRLKCNARSGYEDPDLADEMLKDLFPKEDVLPEFLTFWFEDYIGKTWSYRASALIGFSLADLFIRLSISNNGNYLFGLLVGMVEIYGFEKVMQVRINYKEDQLQNLLQSYTRLTTMIETRRPELTPQACCTIISKKNAYFLTDLGLAAVPTLLK